MNPHSGEESAWVKSLTLLGVGITEMLAVPAGAAYLGYWLGGHLGAPVLGAVGLGIVGFAAGTYRIWQRARWATQAPASTEQERKPE